MKQYVCIIFIFSTVAVFSQFVSPFVMAASGDFGNTGNMFLSWTLGETFGTTLDNGSNKITQGFHQPLKINDSIPYNDSGSIIPTGITPNGDGLNDSWIIDGIDSVKNTVYIFNRWGDLIWKANDYNNTSIVWKGDNSSGALMPSATYFFVIITNKRTEKGWIELLK